MPAGNIRKPSETLLRQSIKTAWHDSSPESTVKGFKKCCVSNIINPLKPKLNPICYLLALLGAHHFLHVSRIRVKSLTLR